MSVIILHLSDIHIKNSNDPILAKGEAIARCIYEQLANASNLIILISGDIAFSGNSEQYALAKKFLEDIQIEIEQEKELPITYILAPGNHDCDFSLDNKVRKIVVKNLQSETNPEVDIDIIEACTDIQKSFFEFRDDIEANQTVSDDRLVRETSIEVNGKKINFIALNVSWISEIHEQPGFMHFPVRNYEHLLYDRDGLELVVLHHPLNWFNQSTYRPFREFVKKKGDIIISGHEHIGNVGKINDAESGASAFVEGCVLQEGKILNESAFNIVEIDLESSQFSSTKYQFLENSYRPREEGSWSSFHNLSTKANNEFDITETFLERLDDPGALFRHPSKTELKLDDIFIFQDLKSVLSSDDKRRTHVSSQKLLSLSLGQNGLFLEGEEKVGKTSLLYQLFLRFHEQGKLPVYIHGDQINKHHPREIDQLIKKAVVQQYGRDKVEKFYQQPKSLKILLLDDFDCGPIKASDFRGKVLGEFDNRFSYMIVTVSDMFEFRELFNTERTSCTDNMDHYKVQTFGYSLRSQLAEKWFNLGRNGTIDEAQLIAMCDNAERLMETAMTKTVIPSLPLYLLTLLQSIEAGRAGEFQESALGDYYHYLLTEAFLCSGVKKEHLKELFHYATQLSAEFYIINENSLSERQLRRFNEKFSKKWDTVNFSQRLKLLLKAKLLYKSGEEYSFRYPYIYYFLKGKYLSVNLSDQGNKDYIKHCCNHLYVRDYANTILFLAHHTTNNCLLDNISSAMNELFKQHDPLSFGDDTLPIRKLIDDAPKLTYTESRPVENREKVNQLRDELDDGHDGLIEKEEQEDELSKMSQLTMLFKTNEILGQILKNQYSEIERVKKRDLLKDLFNGPLRALKDFYDYFDDNNDLLVSQIESVILNKQLESERNKGRDNPVTDLNNTEKRNKMARRIVANVVRMLSFGFIWKTARNANSEKLLEHIEDTVLENETLSFQLIELAVLLDSPKAIPRSKLSKLYEKSGSDPVLKNIIHVLIMHRLYMFETDRKDMEWLSNNTDIDMKRQQTAVYTSKGQRMAN